MSEGSRSWLGMMKSRSAYELRVCSHDRTTSDTFGRSLPLFTNRHWASDCVKYNERWTARTTHGVRVADTAMMGVPRGKNTWSFPRVPYFFRKSAPQWTIQCASSMNMEIMLCMKAGLRRMRLWKVRDWSISGEMRMI